MEMSIAYNSLNFRKPLGHRDKILLKAEHILINLITTSTTGPYSSILVAFKAIEGVRGWRCQVTKTKFGVNWV